MHPIRYVITRPVKPASELAKEAEIFTNIINTNYARWVVYSS